MADEEEREGATLDGAALDGEEGNGGEHHEGEQEEDGHGQGDGDESESEGGNGQQEESVPLKLFVGQVPKDLTEEELKEVFEVVGPVKHAMIIRDRVTRLHRGEKAG